MSGELFRFVVVFSALFIRELLIPRVFLLVRLTIFFRAVGIHRLKRCRQKGGERKKTNYERNEPAPIFLSHKISECLRRKARGKLSCSEAAIAKKEVFCCKGIVYWVQAYIPFSSGVSEC